MTMTGTRGVYRADQEANVDYKVYDADHHYYPPDDADVRHLEPEFRDRAFPERFHRIGMTELMGDEHIAKTVGEHPIPEGGFAGVKPEEMPEMAGDIPVPGAMLNKLNPMKGLTAREREELVKHYRRMEPAFQDRELRLQLMDEQGVQACVLHSGAANYAYAFGRGDIEAGYAVARAFNKWIVDDWGWAYHNRIFVPAVIPLVDPDLAVAELERVIAEGVRLVNVPTGGQWGNSPADIKFDPFWARVQEADCRIAIHLGGHFGKRGAEWGEDPETHYKDFNGFQWITEWSDFPIMETVTCLIFHGLFNRFPKLKVLIAEHGIVWMPYLLRKMDHAFLLGRRPKFEARLPGRPSEMFREHFVVAPFPEENVQRGIEVVGNECLVFGSDFPHSEGLPDPLQYVSQLAGLDDVVVRNIMRDNLGRFLGLPL